MMNTCREDEMGTRSLQAKPIIKWAGGKARLLPTLLPMMPEDTSDYVEPFAGGLAVLFAIAPQTAHINDNNPELVNLYEVVRDAPAALVEALGRHAKDNSESHFYDVRALDRDAETFEALSRVERAARFVYLNKTAYNGLWRVNSKGQMNAPYGRYKRPAIVNADGIRAAHEFFADRDVVFTTGDFADTLPHIKCGTFVYLDPPYDPISKTAAYTGYTPGGFGREDQERLRDYCDELNERGASFMLSNADTEFINCLYHGYHIVKVKAPRAISCKSDGRKAVSEVVVTNYA